MVDPVERIEEKDKRAKAIATAQAYLEQVHAQESGPSIPTSIPALVRSFFDTPISSQTLRRHKLLASLVGATSEQVDKILEKWQKWIKEQASEDVQAHLRWYKACSNLSKSAPATY